ncbi:hypothetical protein CEXT_712051 [Caerostris extrusa]|uniref:Uncharacterized protein n=1 Tax=Caerostris extrusa TaxID=172846 RepID=A0AAV4S835_CAEEX|nr:hypothetical protein CEXT_712051 [Caerostris extrusa]
MGTFKTSDRVFAPTTQREPRLDILVTKTVLRPGQKQSPLIVRRAKWWCPSKEESRRSQGAEPEGGDSNHPKKSRLDETAQAQ